MYRLEEDKIRAAEVQVITPAAHCVYDGREHSI